MKRRILLGSLALLLVWVLSTHVEEVRMVWHALRGGEARWILVALALQIVFYTCYVAIYQTSFWAVGMKVRLWDMYPVVLASLAVNLAVPHAGAALFIEDARQRGQPAARAVAGSVLVRVADFSTFVVVLTVGFAYLFRQHQLETYQIIGAIALLGVIGGLTLVLVLGLISPSALGRLLSVTAKLVRRISRWLRRTSPLDEDWAQRTAGEYTEAGRLLAHHPHRLLPAMAVAMVAHVVDLLSLHALFVGFHTHLELGKLIAGFATGMLFWIVAITPQGLGVVESAMVLAYTGLDVPFDIATAVSLSFRGLTFWLPTLIGFALVHRVAPEAGRPALPRARSWPVRVAALLTAGMGLVNVLSAVYPALDWRKAILQRYSPVFVQHGGRLTAVLAGFALLVLARGLARRKRAAYVTVIGVLVASALGHLAKGLDYEEALLSAALLAYLLALQPHFHARSDAPSLRYGLKVLGGALLFTLAYGVAGFWLLDRHFQMDFGFRDALRQTIVMFTEFYDPGLEPVTSFGQYFAASIYAVGIATFGSALVLLLRPVLLRGAVSPADRARAREIVQAHGRSASARLTLLPDKTYWFSPEGAVVAYTVRNRVALTLGDPIGPAESIAPAVAGFQALCGVNDWLPAFYETRPEHLAAYEAAGLRVLCIGHDAVVELADFTLAGKSARPLRTPVNRCEKDGYVARIVDPPLTPDLLARLREVSDEWLTFKRGNEKRFALGWFDETYLGESPAMVVEDADGQVVAFANLIPEYQLPELTVDLMRHREDAVTGTMEFLFVRLLEHAKAQGYATFNLGLSSLSGVGERSTDPLIERALHYIYEHVERYYNFRGLHQFKSKFHPRWEPRYLVHPGTAHLPAVWAAIMRANGGEDFVAGYTRR
ncbi:MAG: flippase-like domain-containing protein [Armatimonadetes bacterium]|nr:flippase-like domain-containing protein [Armatimonadota bacterium]